MSFFGVNVTNPFSTQVGQKIEQAIDPNLPTENWALYMEICDIINDTEDGPRDAIKAIKRKLNQSAGKNYKVVMYTLTVLETCVKNCGKRFHTLACSRDFVQELVKLIGPKNEPPMEVQEKVLNLIKCWATTFCEQPYGQGVTQIYQELRAKGIEFPSTDLDSTAPIITPERSVPVVDIGSLGAEAAAAIPPAAGQRAQGRDESHIIRSSGGIIHLNEHQMIKLRSELDTVQANMRVLSEMLTAQSNGPQPGTSEEIVNEDLELLTELFNTCKAMQERVVDLIGKLDHDELTAELLHVNDEMNNLFLRYTRFTKNSSAVPPSELVARAIGTGASKKLDAKDSLIDLSDDEGEAAAAPPNSPLDKRIAEMSLSGQSKDNAKNVKKDTKDNEKDEFDAFAQSRTTSFDTGKPKDEPEPPGAMGGKNNQTEKALTASEFERFLAERTAAAAAEVSNPTANSSNPGSNQHQIKKDAEEKSLLAL